jgi:DNA-binding MarR family transcriptional regulator
MEPITHNLIAVTKKYLSAFSSKVKQLPLDRYFYVLVLIETHEEKLTQKALAELLQIDKSYMVTILNYLEEKGYTRREKNKDDRREQHIKLTTQAETDLPVIKKAFNELNIKSLQNLSAEKIEIFNEVLQIIQTNLSDSSPTNIILEYKKI